jgi:hypothetical protein
MYGMFEAGMNVTSPVCVIEVDIAFVDGVENCMADLKDGYSSTS